MLIKSFGLFWRSEEIEWHPGTGNKAGFRLLGRRGTNTPGLRVADFRNMKGIYILYGNYGPHYVGLSRARGIGKRLKDHISDHHEGKWDRFSWFGFGEVVEPDKKTGICSIKDAPELGVDQSAHTIADVEALLIKAMGLSNINKMNFKTAVEWYQVLDHEVTKYTGKVKP
jgi:hypothetical protein